MWTADWDGDFVVGGDGNLRLTPAFRLKEFRGADGTVRVHRELVSALQLLRERCGHALAVRRTLAAGLGAVVSGDSSADVQAAAAAMLTRGMFDDVTVEPDGIAVTLAEPARLPAVAIDEALETAFSVTAAFETAGDMFQQVTGNFDGAGLSFGPAQVNFGSGTLVPLVRAFQAADADAFREAFTDPDDFSDWLRIMDRPVADQVQWANSISTGRGRHDVIDPWKGYFQAIGRVPRFRAITVETILRDYGGITARAIAALQHLRPDISIDNLRCICSLYDLAVQQGSLDKAWTAIDARVTAERPTSQFDLVRIAVEERGRKAAPEWQADAISRRVGILKGVPFTVDDRQRANIQFYLLRNVAVSGVGRLMATDLRPELTRVCDAVATGSTLLV